MDELVFARLQMALTLGFHTIFAAIGVAMPFFMVASYGLYLRGHGNEYKTLTKAWSKGVAIFFAVGAISGTALSVELGLLWPKFMEIAGPIFGMAFAWEGTAFFLEAIALGIFLYGWDRVRPLTHWLSALVVGMSGVSSALFVVCANSWMNFPTGFEWNGGRPIHIDPYAVFFHEGALLQGLHMVVACFEAVGFAVAGIHALLFLKTKFPLHEKAFKISFYFAASTALLQPLVGDLVAKSTARRQPLKLAAMEAHFTTQSHAPLHLGGITIPNLLSILVAGDSEAEVKGLNAFPKENWPPLLVTHLAFQTMVILGTFLAFIGLSGLVRRTLLHSTWFLRLIVATIPLGFLAMHAGWIVTEVGRQPWVIYGMMKTSEAVTNRSGLIYTFLLYCLIYMTLSFVVVVLMLRQGKALHRELRGAQ